MCYNIIAFNIAERSSLFLLIIGLHHAETIVEQDGRAFSKAQMQTIILGLSCHLVQS